MTIVTLVSGGIDSLVMSKIIDVDNEKQKPLYIDYGQLANEMEWKACKEIFKETKLPEPKKINLKGFGEFISSGLTDRTKDINSKAFLPGRNLLFLTVASSYAYNQGAGKVAIGLLDEKYHLFPDQTQRFVINSNIAINEAFGRDITIVTPLINFSKTDIIKLAKHYNLPLSKTYSCHTGKQQYCGKCIACKEILNAEGGNKLPQFNIGGD